MYTVRPIVPEVDLCVFRAVTNRASEQVISRLGGCKLSSSTSQSKDRDEVAHFDSNVLRSATENCYQ